jgi:L-histidine Nalpha-methyltransferase
MKEFLDHVKRGLTQNPKALSSRYFYDRKGDELFQKIMQLEEYYLPECEMNIINNQSEHIAKDISETTNQLHIIELGAGDGSKTKFLLSTFRSYFDPLYYTALDISGNILRENKEQAEQVLPEPHVNYVAGNYFRTYPGLGGGDVPRLVLFLGANIGNFDLDDAVDFFKFIQDGLHNNDYFIVAFDMAKHPRKIIRAYDDAAGITRAFNLNLLERMNRELGADFDIEKFDHYPCYNPVTGIAASYIISLGKQTVSLPDGTKFHFEPFEAVHTEISKKFFISDIEYIAEKSNFPVHRYYFDESRGYVFVLFRNGKVL